MPKAVKKKPIAKPKKDRYELDAALLFGVGAFLAISLYFYRGNANDNEIIGLLGKYLVIGLERLFGSVAFLLPAFMGLWSLHIIHLRKYWSNMMVGLSLVCISLLLFQAVYSIPDGLGIWEASWSGLGGGIIGGTLAVSSIKLAGRLGTNLLIVMLALAGMIFILNRSLRQIFGDVVSWGKGGVKTIDQMLFYEENKVHLDPAVEPIIVGARAKPEPDRNLPRLEREIKTDHLAEVFHPVRPRKKSEIGHYTPPPLDMLSAVESDRNFNRKDIKESIKTLEDTFANFGMKIKVNQVSCGPAVTRYELQPAPGIKVSKILSLSDDLQMSLAARAIRIEAPIPGKSAVGIEVPNEKTTPVGLKNVLMSPVYKEAKQALTFVLGEDISGNPVIANLAEMPHLLIAGSTGSGKSVCLNSLILSLLFRASPEELRLVLIDPKMVEMTQFNGIPHLMAPVVTDPKKAAMALRWMLSEMEKRYKKFADHGVRDIDRFNEASTEKLPFIVIVIDELADLMMVSPVDVEDAICRLAQMARAAGIHLVVATQRPSVDVVTGIIKANIPSRIAFAVSSQTDSRTILDVGGAEKLLGRGDMLFFPVGASKPLRIQGAFVSDAELERVVGFLKDQNTSPENEEPEGWDSFADNIQEMDADDDLFWDAVRVFVETDKASASLLQRKLRVGYARAARLVDIMEDRGIVSAQDVNRKREMLIDAEQLEQLLERRL